MSTESLKENTDDHGDVNFLYENQLQPGSDVKGLPFDSDAGIISGE